MDILLAFWESGWKLNESLDRVIVCVSGSAAADWA